jgi:hypothetical protein
VIKSVPDLKAPLEEVFSNRFDPEWTLQLENSILSEIVEKRIAGGPTPDRIAAFISSNLQEDVTLEGPRLSSQTVAKILRK